MTRLVVCSDSDSDECVSLPGVCGSARCENVEGSFMCECDGPGEEFHPGSRECVSTAPQGTRWFFDSPLIASRCAAETLRSPPRSRARPRLHLHHLPRQRGGVGPGAAAPPPRRQSGRVEGVLLQPGREGNLQPAGHQHQPAGVLLHRGGGLGAGLPVQHLPPHRLR